MIVAVLIEALADRVVPLLCFPAVVFLVFTLHELGHYLAARLLGVRVLSFDVGFGPRLWRGTDRRGTVWSLHLLPLCGLVKLAGQEDGQDRAHMTPDLFCARPLRERAAITAAGPLMNIALAFLFLLAAYASIGVPSTRTDVLGVEVGSPAMAAGLQPGDEILAMDGHPVRSGEVLTRAIERQVDKTMMLDIRSGSEYAQAALTPTLLACRDGKGFDCSRGYSGLIVMARPLSLSALARVAGEDTQRDNERTTALLRAHGGALVTLSMDSIDGGVRDYVVRLLEDGGVDEDLAVVYFRTGEGAFYDRPGVAAKTAEAARQTMRLVTGTSYVALQMFPVERVRFAPQVQVPRRVDAFAHDLYKVLYIGALMSVFVAFFNMLPLPWLDGGVLLRLAAEGALGYRRAQALGPYISRGVVVLLFIALAFFHARDFVRHFGIDI